MPIYFAAALADVGGTWSGREIDLETIEDLDALVEELRDLAEGGTALFVLEEDDEYFGIVRVDGDGDPRAFISDARSILTSPFAAMLMEELATVPVDDDDEESTRPDPEPAGDTDIVADFGIEAENLLDLCAVEGMLPADVITAICEKAGCSEVLEDLRA